MPVQTRYSTTLNGDITDVATELIVDAAPANTTGYGTIDRGGPTEEDFKWTGLSGLQMTGLLRGLSKTALTDTEVGGNKQAHSDEETVEGTLLHYIINNKADLDEDETYTGDNTYSGDNSHTGTETFADDKARSTSNAAPSNDLSFTNKKYVDDQDALAMPLSYLDTDDTLAANSDTKVASQQATKAYVDNQVSTVANNKVAVSSNETAPGFLEDQIVDDANSLILWTTQNDGGDETLRGDLQVAALKSTLGLTRTATAAEAIDGSSTPQHICRGGENYKKTIVIHMDGSDNEWSYVHGSFADLAVGDASANNRQAQSFTITDAAADSIVLNRAVVFLKKTGTPSDNFQLLVQGDNSGEPDNTTITNGSSNALAGGSVNTAYNAYAFSWSTPPTITSGSLTWIAFDRDGGDDGSNYYHLAYEAADNYSGHNSATYNAGVGSWSTSANDVLMYLEFTVDYGGKVMKLDVDDPCRCNYIGATESNVAASGSVTYLPPGTQQASFSGLTLAAPYFGSTTAGSHSTSPPDALGATTVLVGAADSATTLSIKDGLKTFSGNVINMDFNATTTATDLDLAIPCGFQPVVVDLMFTKAEDGASQDGVVMHRWFDGTKNVGQLLVDGIDGGFVSTGITAFGTDPSQTLGFYSDEVAVQSTFENGFYLRFSQNDTGDALSNIFFRALGY